MQVPEWHDPNPNPHPNPSPTPNPHPHQESKLELEWLTSHPLWLPVPLAPLFKALRWELLF